MGYIDLNNHTGQWNFGVYAKATDFRLLDGGYLHPIVEIRNKRPCVFIRQANFRPDRTFTIDIPEGKNSLCIVACPEIAAACKVFGLLLDLRSPTTLTIDAEAEAVSFLTFPEAGLQVPQLKCDKLCNNLTVSLFDSTTTQSESADVLCFTDNGFLAQGQGVEEFLIFRDGKTVSVTVDFTDTPQKEADL